MAGGDDRTVFTPNRSLAYLIFDFEKDPHYVPGENDDIYNITKRWLRFQHQMDKEQAGTSSNVWYDKTSSEESENEKPKTLVKNKERPKKVKNVFVKKRKAVLTTKITQGTTTTSLVTDVLDKGSVNLVMDRRLIWKLVDDIESLGDISQSEDVNEENRQQTEKSK